MTHIYQCTSNMRGISIHFSTHAPQIGVALAHNALYIAELMAGLSELRESEWEMQTDQNSNFIEILFPQEISFKNFHLLSKPYPLCILRYWSTATGWNHASVLSVSIF